mgnify:CR=1 FL=1
MQVSLVPLGSSLGIIDGVEGLEATQSGEFTVINVGEPRRNSKADVLAELPWLNIKVELLNKLVDVIENVVSCPGRKELVLTKVYQEYQVYEI